MATSKKNPESIVREIKRKTRRVFNAEVSRVIIFPTRVISSPTPLNRDF